jgi:transcriptional regulator with XRE-family HTH domain
VLVDWYKNTNLIKIANENNVTYDDIAIGCGVNISSVSRAMRKSTNTPSYNTLKCLKEYFDKLENNKIVVDEWINQPCKTMDVNEFVMPELEKCDEEPTEHMEKCDEEEDIRRRYQTEIEENNVIIETYQGIIDKLTMRNKVCEEVLKVIEELRGE